MNIIQQMHSSGTPPNVIAYTSLIKGLSSEGRIEESLQILKDMVAANVEPNHRTYNGIHYIITCITCVYLHACM
jgi:pentatricopeptide repeat protein